MRYIYVGAGCTQADICTYVYTYVPQVFVIQFQQRSSSHMVYTVLQKAERFSYTNISTAYTCTNMSGVGQVHMNHEVPLNLL